MDKVTGPLLRWATFNGVGLMGVAVQLGVLAAMLRVVELPVVLATAVAVEAALLHNFAWHHRCTWGDRAASGARDVLGRLGRFHALNGTISIVGNVVMTSALTVGGLDPLLANLASIAACSTANFFAGDRLVFSKQSSVSLCLCGVLVFSFLSVASKASSSEESLAYVSGPSGAAVAAWEKYIATIDARLAQASPKDFFALDMRRADKWRERTKSGGVPMANVDPPSAPDARIHHWAGAIYVSNVTVDAVIRRLQEYAGRESEFYQEVRASKLLERDGDRVRVFLRLERGAAGITATLNTEHAVEYRRLGPTRTASRSVSTKIAEIQDAGKAGEREKPPGNDSGFLWRLNAYWRFEQAADGVLIECESVSLSRSVPFLIRPIAAPIVNRIARESLERTLRSLRTFLTKQP